MTHPLLTPTTNPCTECGRETCEGTHVLHVHPKTGHAYHTYKEDVVLPKTLTIEVTPSQYPGEEHYLMAEASGIVMLPDGQAKLWCQIGDGLTIPKAVQCMADMLKAVWDECLTEDEPGVPHCYCRDVTCNQSLAAIGGQDPVPGFQCCRCEASAPLEYFGLSTAEPIDIPKAQAEADRIREELGVKGCALDTDGDGNCPIHPDGCAEAEASKVAE